MLKRIEIDLLVHQAIEQRRLSFDETQNDILRRVLFSLEQPQERPALGGSASADASEESAAMRSRGLWTVEVLGECAAAPNMIEAYRTLLLALHAKFPDFLEKFSKQKSRSRRFVARSAPDLYDRSPHLADSFAEKLVDGWFFDSNLSTSQVAMRARMAASVLGLRYGRDVRLLDNLKQL